MGTFITSLRRNVELGHSRIGSATWEDHQNPSPFQLFFLCYSQCVSCITLQVAGWLLLFHLMFPYVPKENMRIRGFFLASLYFYRIEHSILEGSSFCLISQHLVNWSLLFSGEAGKVSVLTFIIGHRF